MAEMLAELLDTYFAALLDARLVVLMDGQMVEVKVEMLVLY